jgi:hypothetical protein
MSNKYTQKPIKSSEYVEERAIISTYHNKRVEKMAKSRHIIKTWIRNPPYIHIIFSICVPPYSGRNSLNSGSFI